MEKGRGNGIAAPFVLTFYRRIGKAIKIYFDLAQDSKGKRIEKINCIFLKFYAILWVYDIDNPIKKEYNG